MLRQEALDRISTPADLEELVRVTSPRTWLALIAAISLLVVVALWATVTTLASTVGGRGALVSSGGVLIAVVYIAPEDASRIKGGMDVQLTLPAVNRQQEGVLLAKVDSLEDFPSSRASMLSTIGNDAYVEALASSNHLVAVRLSLERTGDHYHWTLAHGSEVALHAGMICDATIIVDEVHPISLVKPE